MSGAQRLPFTTSDSDDCLSALHFDALAVREGHGETRHGVGTNRAWRRLTPSWGWHACCRAQWKGGMPIFPCARSKKPRPRARHLAISPVGTTRRQQGRFCRCCNELLTMETFMCSEFIKCPRPSRLLSYIGFQSSIAALGMVGRLHAHVHRNLAPCLICCTTQTVGMTGGGVSWCWFISCRQPSLIVL